jgi:hypothetical protein
MRTIEKELAARIPKCAWAVLFFFLCAFSAVTAAQCGSVNRDSPEAVKMEVNRLFNKTLDRMEYTLPSGVKVATWMGWEPSTQDQIKCLGNTAVPATAELLRSAHRPFGDILAVLMLGWEGGPEIVPPLTEVLAPPSESAKLDSVKFAALESLAAAPPEKALPIIQEVLRTEKNPQLLEKAASVAARLKGSPKD